MSLLDALVGKAAPDELLVALELHAVDRLRAVLDSGAGPGATIRGKTPVTWLTEMYTRSDGFPACLRVLLDRGAALDDPAIAPVLLNDAAGLRAALAAHPSLLTHRTTMVSAFTPLAGASLLHVAAEYGHTEAAAVLIEMGADVNATADVDPHGFNGHTPLFHTVNSNGNRDAAVNGGGSANGDAQRRCRCWQFSPSARAFVRVGGWVT